MIAEFSNSPANELRRPCHATLNRGMSQYGTLYTILRHTLMAAHAARFNLCSVASSSDVAARRTVSTRRSRMH